jgi:hypothetical protein
MRDPPVDGAVRGILNEHSFILHKTPRDGKAFRLVLREVSSYTVPIPSKEREPEELIPPAVVSRPVVSRLPTCGIAWCVEISAAKPWHRVGPGSART